jgi:hypothetical protein
MIVMQRAELDLTCSRLLKQQSTCRHIATNEHNIFTPSLTVFVLKSLTCLFNRETANFNVMP